MIITIFTPTYNRQDKLFRLYESLKSQKNNDFEWLIIDDGSQDNTEEVVNSFIEEKKITIKYIKQSNGGKHTAYNTALNYATGEYFFCIDSDDWLNENFINKFIKEIVESESYGYIAYKTDSDGNLLSKKFPKDLVETTLFDLSEVYGCSGEFSIILKTNIAKKFKFPIFKNEKFIGESVVYDRIGEQYQFTLMKEIATICEYQNDGLTVNYNHIMKKNPSGFCLYYMQRIDLTHPLFKKLVISGKFHAFKLFSKNKNINYNGKNKMFVLFAKPLGVLFFIYYKIVRGF